MRFDSRDEGVALLAGGGLGAALMYLLDPNRGAARRAQLADQTGGIMRSARRDLDIARRDLSHRAHGLAAEARSRLSDEDVSDEQLTERVRAELGHHANSLRRVDVTTTNGRVTLAGEVDAEAHDRLVSAARHVRGVEAVDDLLTDRRG
jgi:osmotically-inducible protein OsmY